MSTNKRFTFSIASLLLCGVAIAQSQQEIRNQFFRETDIVKKRADELNAKILAPAVYAEGLELYASAGERVAKGKDLDRVRAETLEGGNLKKAGDDAIDAEKAYRATEAQAIGAKASGK